MPKIKVHFRGSAIVPFLNRIAGFTTEVDSTTLLTIVDSVYRRRVGNIQVCVIGGTGKETILTQANYKDIIRQMAAAAEKSVAPTPVAPATPVAPVVPEPVVAPPEPVVDTTPGDDIIEPTTETVTESTEETETDTTEDKQPNNQGNRQQYNQYKKRH